LKYHRKLLKNMGIHHRLKSVGVKMSEYIRPSWDEYFMEVCEAISKRATCERGRSGCVIARNKQILVTGYVGAPTGLLHCDEVGHQFKKMLHEDGNITNHCVRTVHAEQNAICQAAKMGIPIDGATLYCRMTPCRTCAMLIINCGIKRVVCQRLYHDSENSIEMLKKAGIVLEHLHDELQQYDSQ
jgi:dCMP deaminase